MTDSNIYRAKAIDDGRWVSGELHTMSFRPHIHVSPIEKVDIDIATASKYTGWNDKKNKPIYEGDILAMVLPDNSSSRLFVVEWQHQVRHLKPLDGFEDDGTPVEITGWCFRLGCHRLLPSYIGHVGDYRRMEVVGNIYDNPGMIADLPESHTTGKHELIGNTCCLSNKPEVQVFMYDLKDSKGSWLARVILTSDGVYMSYSEYGNFFHYFTAPGKDGIRPFMLRITPDYFGQKLCEVEWNTAPTKVAAAAKRHAKYVLPVLQEAIRKQLDQEQ